MLSYTLAIQTVVRGARELLCVDHHGAVARDPWVSTHSQSPWYAIQSARVLWLLLTAMTVTSGDIDKLFKAVGGRYGVPKLLWRLAFSDQSDIERTSKNLRYCIPVVVLLDLCSHDQPQLTAATAA